MANADLKVLKVFTQDNKQIDYKVMCVDGSIIKVSRDQMVQAISLGHKYVNATVSSSGLVRVSSDVPREDISINKKSINHNMISHSFDFGFDNPFKLQVAKDSPDEIPCKARHRVIQGYAEDFLDEQDIENLGYSNSRHFLEDFAKSYYKNRKKPKGCVVMHFSYDVDDKPSLWNKFYIIEFDCANISNELENRALGRYVIVTTYNTFLKIVKEDNISYEAYKDYFQDFPGMCCISEISYKEFNGLFRSNNFGFPFKSVGGSCFRRNDLICIDKKTYKDFYKICTELEKLKVEIFRGSPLKDDIIIANGDLKVLCVYIQEGKLDCYKVENSYGNVIRADYRQMLQALSDGHRFSNATVDKKRDIRVSSDVPRKAIYTDSQDKNPLIYRNMHWHNILDLMESKDSKKISHTFNNLGFGGGSFNLQVPIDCPDEIPCKIRHRVIQGYLEDFLSERDLENLCYANSTNYIRTVGEYYYKNREEPTGYIIFSLGSINEDESFWGKFYIIEFDYVETENLFKLHALSRYVLTTLYNLFFKIIRDEKVPYECYKDCLDNFLSLYDDCKTTYRYLPCFGGRYPFEFINADAYHIKTAVCPDKKTYKDFYKIYTKLEQLKK